MFKQLMIPGNRLPLIQRRSFHPVNVAVLCCVAFLAATTPALAQWGSVGGGGSTGVYNGQGYERSDDSYGSARSYPLASTASAGPTRRLALRAHDYHAARTTASSQNGGYGSTGGYGSSGGYGSTGDYGSSGDWRATDRLNKTFSEGPSLHSPPAPSHPPAAASTPVLSSRLAVGVPHRAGSMVTALNTKDTGLTRQFAGSKFEPSREQAFLLYADSPAGSGKLISQREPISPKQERIRVCVPTPKDVRKCRKPLGESNSSLRS